MFDFSLAGNKDDFLLFRGVAARFLRRSFARTSRRLHWQLLLYGLNRGLAFFKLSLHVFKLLLKFSKLNTWFLVVVTHIGVSVRCRTVFDRDEDDPADYAKM